MTFSIRLAGLPIGITCTENLAVSREEIGKAIDEKLKRLVDR